MATPCGIHRGNRAAADRGRSPGACAGNKHHLPQAIERGRRSSRTVILATAQLNIHGVSTHAIAKLMAAFSLQGLSSSQVSTLQHDLLPCLVPDARYEKARMPPRIGSSWLRDAAARSAVGNGEDTKLGNLGDILALFEGKLRLSTFTRSAASAVNPGRSRSSTSASWTQRRSVSAVQPTVPGTDTSAA